MKKRLIFPVSVLFFVIMALLLMIKVPFIYTVNDDLFMKNILSGAYLGSPDAHTVYMEYPLCLVLAGLYRMSNLVPWYGICFFLFHCISWGSIVYRICTGYESGNYKKRFLAAGFVTAVFFACGFYHIASMQFTVTAAILGAAALVWFYTADFNLPLKKVLADQSVTALFVFLSFNVRRNVLLMFIPIAGMLWLHKWVLEKKRWDREVLLRYLGTAGISLLAVAATIVSYRMAYGLEGWQYYISYNDHATVLYDYYEWPDYEQNQELYEELGISYEGYYGAKEAYFLAVDSGIDREAMIKLAERSNVLHQNETSFFQRMKDSCQVILERSFGETDRPINLIVVGLYGIVILTAVLARKKTVFFSLGALFAGRMFSWLYVVYEGRYPVRISQSLFLAEAAVLLAIFWKECMPKRESHYKWSGLVQKMLLGGMIAVLLFFSFTRIRHVYRENVWRLAESQDLQDVNNYCREHIENFYFIDSKSISSDTENIFDPAGSGFQNYIVFGGWLSGSPVYREKLGLGQAEEVEEALLWGDAYVIFKNGEEYPVDYVKQYFDSKYQGFSMEEVEQFGRNGNRFSVYRLRAEE